MKRLLPSEHFSVDGTLIEAWASMKSFRPKDDDGSPPAGGRRNVERDFHGETRTNDSHASTTDPDARLARKGAGKEAKLCFMGHVMMENRNGLAVDVELTRASGHAERLAALAMVGTIDHDRPVTVGADKDTTRGTSSTTCANSRRRRMWHSTPAADAPPSTAAQPAIPATR